ncbi:hypothetical protein LZ31DRAFT_291277 [Colletotrichum somersetense]|nr:hypothetical protein LZ31DRAFT_291277 [Colletotrichum somersetense]
MGHQVQALESCAPSGPSHAVAAALQSGGFYSRFFSTFMALAEDIGSMAFGNGPSIGSSSTAVGCEITHASPERSPPTIMSRQSPRPNQTIPNRSLPFLELPVWDLVIRDKPSHQPLQNLPKLAQKRICIHLRPWQAHSPSRTCETSSELGNRYQRIDVQNVRNFRIAQPGYCLTEPHLG